MFYFSILIGTMLIDCCSEAVITVFDEIHSRHPWFLIYTVPESTRATQFSKMDTHFFDTLAKVLQAGFSIDETSWSLSKIVSHIKSSLRNYIYKRRSKQGYIQEMLEEFKILLKRDPVFRSTEFFVHESQPNYYQPSSSTEQSVEPEEPVVIPENDISIEKNRGRCGSRRYILLMFLLYTELVNCYFSNHLSTDFKDDFSLIEFLRKSDIDNFLAGDRLGLGISGRKDAEKM
uniref:Uncharacterized protein n=1 Tax=Caenorhabditis japonica TaxID=281687 RepID=A0A8R1HNR9_CAEJA